MGAPEPAPLSSARGAVWLTLYNDGERRTVQRCFEKYESTATGRSLAAASMPQTRHVRERTLSGQVSVIHHIVRKYYECFNERRFAEAADLLSNDVQLDYPGAEPGRGRDAYTRLTTQWVRAFPNLTVVVLDIEERGDTISEVRLAASGTHRGMLDLGSAGTFAAHGAHVTFEQRDLLEIRVGKITFARMTLNVAALVAQLTPGPATLM